MPKRRNDIHAEERAQCAPADASSMKDGGGWTTAGAHASTCGRRLKGSGHVHTCCGMRRGAAAAAAALSAAQRSSSSRRGAALPQRSEPNVGSRRAGSSAAAASECKALKRWRALWARGSLDASVAQTGCLSYVARCMLLYVAHCMLLCALWAAVTAAVMARLRSGGAPPHSAFAGSAARS